MGRQRVCPHVAVHREVGTVQPTRAEVAKYWNEPPEKSRVRGNDNTVQPWKVASDGSVLNGLS